MNTCELGLLTHFTRNLSLHKHTWETTRFCLFHQAEQRQLWWISKIIMSWYVIIVTDLNESLLKRMCSYFVSLSIVVLFPNKLGMLLDTTRYQMLKTLGKCAEHYLSVTALQTLHPIRWLSWPGSPSFTSFKRLLWYHFIYGERLSSDCLLLFLVHSLAALGVVDVCGAQCTSRVQHSALELM